MFAIIKDFFSFLIAITIYLGAIDILINLVNYSNDSGNLSFFEWMRKKKPYNSKKNKKDIQNKSGYRSSNNQITSKRLPNVVLNDYEVENERVKTKIKNKTPKNTNKTTSKNSNKNTNTTTKKKTTSAKPKAKTKTTTINKTHTKKNTKKTVNTKSTKNKSRTK